MLPLNRQELYRQKYQTLRPDWRWSGARYEAIIRRHLQVDNSSRIVEKKMLDLGCGAGGVIELFSERVILPVGIDIDLPSLHRYRDEAVRLVAGSLEQLPFSAQSFDLVICSWALEHLLQPSLVFAEVARVLKPHGHFVFLTPNARSIITRMNRLVPQQAQGRLVRIVYGRAEADTFPTAYRVNTVEQIDSLARAAGLQPVQLETVSDPTYLAFNDLLFWLSVAVERYLPQESYVHIVGDYVKNETFT